MKKILLLSITLITLSLSRDIPSDNKIQGRLNIINGASAECVMHQFYTQSNWTQIEGEIGRNGIDGLYYNSQSAKNKTIKQMSKEWVLKTMKKLIKKNSSMRDAYNECRTKYLNKYLPMITQDEINTLLTDNYLQKKDIKKIFSNKQGKK